MKTKAYSKEGLSAASKLDPKEKEKAEACDFLSSMVDELGQQIEAMEAEEESIHATLKKGKKDVAKANRLADISRVTERHKWHIGRLELLLRSLQNGMVETNQVNDAKESIKYYVDDGHNVDYQGEDETLYDDFSLDDEEGQFGMVGDQDKGSSQDTQSVQEEEPEQPRPKGKEPAPVRRPSMQLKSPLPVLATLNMNAPASAPQPNMKPAPLPTRAPETLKYASAAAAAAASDKNGVGIAPLPPPPGAAAPPAGVSSLPTTSRGSAAASPIVALSQPVAKVASTAASSSASVDDFASTQIRSAAASPKVPTITTATRTATPPQPPAPEKTASPDIATRETSNSTPSTLTNGDAADSEEAIYHLPPGLQDLIQSFETTKLRISANPSPAVQRLLLASHNSCPEPLDADRPRHYKTQAKFRTPSYYPQEVLPIFDDPRLYETGRIETDTLFYIFYYRQASYQQYLAAKSLKNQSWRFHKQYQTWFQRHEEPKQITEDYEQGTYRFFDYESTW